MPQSHPTHGRRQADQESLPISDDNAQPAASGQDGARGRKRGVIDLDSSALVLHPANGAPFMTFRLDDLPPLVQRWAGLFGLRQFLVQNESPADAWRRLTKGELPERRQAATQTRDVWLEAIAQTIVADTAAAGATMTEVEARQYAAALSPGNFAKATRRPAVAQRYLEAIAGDTDGKSGVLDLIPAR